MAGKDMCMSEIQSAVPPAFLRHNVFNPMMKFMLSSPLHGATSGFMMVMCTKGRKSGRAIDVPVSYHVLDGVVTAFSSGPWVGNIRNSTPFEVWYKGKRVSATADIVDDPDQVAAALHRVYTEIGNLNAPRFGFKITGSDTPSIDQFKQALEGRKMIKLKM
ncbi:MAG: PNPOx family protein [Candidatus Xenobia bacterium]